LLVKGGSVEPGVREVDVVEPLLAELRKLAAWLGLETVAIVSRRNGLMKALRLRS
jgi:uncharacterized protein YcaQ